MRIYKTTKAQRLRAAQWYRANKVRAKSRIHEWKKANPEKVKANRKKHRATILEGQRRAYRNRREYYIQQARIWAVSNPDKRHKIARAFHVRNKYGLSATRYLELLSACQGRCPICRIKFSQSGAHIESVDHDHKTGKVRGLICRLCNSGLGMFKDSTQTLRRAVDYLS